MEDYISEKRNGRRIDEKSFTRRLEKLKKTDEQVHQIMIEMDDDCDKELLASSGVKKAKKGLVMSIVIGLSLAVFSILSALGHLFQGNVVVVFYGGIATAFLFGGKSYNEIVGVKLRRKRRELKWKNWR